MVLTICGASYIVTTKCRPVVNGQGGFGSKRVAPEEGSLRALAAHRTTSVLKIRVEAHGLTTNSSL